MQYNPNLEFANMNAYINFGEILSMSCICFQDIEKKQISEWNTDISQGP